MSSRRSRTQSRRLRYDEDAPYEEDDGQDNFPEVTAETTVDEVTRCICGSDELLVPDNSGADFDDVDPGFFIQCDKCSVWQHGYCVGIKGETNAPEKYWCEKCRPDLHYLFVDKYGIQRSQYNANGYGNRKRHSKPNSISESESSEKLSKEEEALEKHKRQRTTINSVRDYDYEAMLKKALEESARESGVQPEKVDAPKATVPPFRNTRSSSRKQSPNSGDESASGSKQNSVSSEHVVEAPVSGKVLRSSSNEQHTHSASGSGNESSAGSSRARRVRNFRSRAAKSRKASGNSNNRDGYRSHGSESDSGYRSGLKTKRGQRSKRGKHAVESRLEDDRPFRANIPNSRISIEEMRRRIYSIMEFISNIKVELTNDEDTKNSMIQMQKEDSSGELRKPENLALQKNLIGCYNDSVVRLESLTKQLSEWESKYC